MAWTAPRTFATSELITAAIMNTHVRDNLLALKKGLIAGGSLQFIWYDSLSGKNPVVDGTTYSDWALCDGAAQNGYTTPDFRNRFIVGAGDTYSQNDTGGATTSAHTHGPGTLATGDNDADHNHANPETSVESLGGASESVAAGADYGITNHTHTQAATGLVSQNHGHSVDSGTTASDSTAILPPYRAAGMFMYAPA